jgi:uncharacterized protein
MTFEYDPKKSEANKAKHGIDFEEAKALWNVVGLVARSDRATEVRYLRIARYMDGVLWSAVYTRREANVRLISVRRSNQIEREAYEKRIT